MLPSPFDAPHATLKKYEIHVFYNKIEHLTRLNAPE